MALLNQKNVRRGYWVYGGLMLVWAVVLVRQIVAHQRVQADARSALVNRARDISSTLGLVIRSQRRFGGMVSKERLQAALAELVRPGELNGVALLNSSGDVVVSAGDSRESDDPLPHGVYWSEAALTLAYPVDLGSTNVTTEAVTNKPTIVITRQNFETNRPPSPTGMVARAEGGPPERDAYRPPPPREPGGPSSYGGRPPYDRYFHLSPEEYQSLLQKQGLHSVIMIMSALPVQKTSQQDLWARFMILIFATGAGCSAWLAWRNLLRTADLEIRLIKASQQNAHLKEMNLAAAGLAHETKNPLNIIRGLAQMISKETEFTPELRDRSRVIMEEADRVTAQVNEFINYSRPREIRVSTVAMGKVVSEVARSLAFDLEEKQIAIEIRDDAAVIEADEHLLRQVVFNLLLNAIQATSARGKIEIVTNKSDGGGVSLEVRDDGYGVPSDQREEIFKPYVTSHQKGTGLGLAVVRQIVTAHDWRIECLPNEPKGAVFRISGMKPSVKN